MNSLIKIYIFIHSLIDTIVDYLFSLYFNSDKRYISPPKNLLVLESASTLARKIRLKEITSEEIVQAFVDRIKAVNDVLNAVVDERFDDALREAKQIDLDIKKGIITEEDFIKKPFLGVPFTTKESTNCKGLKVTYGLISRKNEIGQEDATVIQLMKKAGGILLGVTNVPQLNRWFECYNPVHGVTKNPYNTTRNVGGSSGGEACIIAARGSPIGIGTDIGGSLRIPSHRCGVFGHKPTGDLVSTCGLTFRRGSDWPTMVTAGPMSAHSDDLIPLLKVVLGDNIDKLHLDENVDIEKIKIYYMTSPRCFRASPIPDSMKKLVLKCAEHFNLISETKPKAVDFENTKYAVDLWSHMMLKEADKYTEEIMNNKGDANVFTEIFKYITLQSDFTIYTLANIINIKLLPKPSEEWGSRTLNELKKEIVDTLGDNGVLLFPSEPYPADYHYISILRPFNFSYYGLWNALKLPVTQVPLGLNSEGLPVGIQVVAGPYRDHLSIAVAKELEKAFGGYVPPFTSKE